MAEGTSAKGNSRDRVPQRSASRNIVILCDGTGNELGGALSDSESNILISNVLKFYRIVEKGKRQLVYYTPGVGTIGRIDFLYRWKQKFLGVLGLAMGYGLDDNVLGAYRFLVQNWQEGDKIYLFGFSRGAWTARVLAGFIHLIGLLRPSQLNMCDNAFATYKRAARENKMPIAWHFARVIGSRFPTIHFVGVWDTVASVLVPRSDRMWLPSLEKLPYTETNPSVRMFRHAMALDERRRMFRIAEWVQPQPFVPVRFRPHEFEPQKIEQRWFPGVHSDIGGGYREDESGLSKIPLIWMVEEAEKAGLHITESNLEKFAYGAPRNEGEHQYSQPDPSGEMHKSLGWGWMPLEIIPKAITYREWHRRSFLGLYIPHAEPRPVYENEVVDSSVEARRKLKPGYDPVNLRCSPPPRKKRTRREISEHEAGENS